MRKTAKIVHVIELDESDTRTLEAIFADWDEAVRNYKTYNDGDEKDALIREFNTLLTMPLSERQKSEAHDAVERA